MLKFYTSNRLEVLAAKLAEQMTGGDWHQPDTVLVQSAGMERWINLQLASQRGVSANIEFPFPKSFLIKTLRQSVGLPKQDPFDKELMAWRIYRLLLTLEETPEFSALKSYVAEGDQKLKRVQLSERIADLFDQYLVFRPNTILGWNGLKEEHLFFDKKVELPADLVWQKILWQAVCSEIDEVPYVDALRKFCSEEIDLDKLALPSRLSLFGLSNLPPILMTFFQKLATVIDIDFYYLSPCQQFWSDIVSEKRVSTLDLDENDEYWEVGNPLLSSMGRLGRDFAHVISNIDEVEQIENYVEVEPDSLLHQIQSDILELINPKEAADKAQFSPEDRSIQFVSCHSALREVEVLYDHLLQMLNDDESLEPRDILVMAPDIQQYAPYISAVFDAPEELNLSLPYSISDRDGLEESMVATAFLKLLVMPTLRLTSVEVMELFEVSVIHDSFGIASGQLSFIKRWVAQSNIRWGIDGDFRADCGVPKFEQNSWQAGKARAMMGFAMADDGETLDGLPLPYDLEGSEVLIIGQFLDFTEKLFKYVKLIKAENERSLDQWSALLLHVFTTFFKENQDNSSELKRVRLVLTSLDSQGAFTQFEEQVGLSIVSNILKKKLSETSGANGFLQRGITFCKLLPMRSIPSTVVCILGLNDGEFPRQGPKISFDLVSRQPMLGDRSMKNDDRYLFLEALLSTRQKLYLSYIGRKASDNSVVPPSVLIDELLEYIHAGYELPAGFELVKEQPLQAFSPRYFSIDNALFTFSKEARLSAESLSKLHAPATSLAEMKGFEFKHDEIVKIDFADLLRFYKDPAHYFLKHSLNVDFKKYSDEELSTVEPFEIASGLEAYGIGQSLLEDMIVSRIEVKKKHFDRLVAEGRLPYGEDGKTIFDEFYEQVNLQATAAITEGMTGKARAESFTLFLECPTYEKMVRVELSGVINGIYGDRVISSRWSSGGPKDYIATWLTHLVGNANQIAETSGETLLILGKSKPTVKTLKSMNEVEAQQLLINWVTLFLEGQCKPLCFLVDSSSQYIDQMHSVRNKLEGEARVDAALASAKDNKWLPGYSGGGYTAPSESESKAITFCHGDEFLGYTKKDEFIAIAELLLDPMKEAMQTLKKGDK